MAYEMHNNSLQIEYRAENINQKFPALQMSIKLHNVETKTALWIRDGKYGRQFSTSDAAGLSKFIRALFGSGTSVQTAAGKAAEPAAKKEDAPVITEPERKKLLR